MLMLQRLQRVYISVISYLIVCIRYIYRSVLLPTKLMSGIRPIQSILGKM